MQTDKVPESSWLSNFLGKKQYSGRKTCNKRSINLLG